MFIVAISRWGRPFLEETAALAPLLGLAPSDARLVLAGPLPIVVARKEAEEDTRQLLAALRDRGHGAVACEADRVISSEAMISPRTLDFGDASLLATDPTGGRHELPYAEILALIRATRSSTTESSAVTKKQFSLSRTVLTGGLVRSRRVMAERASIASESEQVLYVIRRSGQEPLLLRERQLQYGSLGNRIARTVAENFAAVVSLLRSRAPDALHDDRLVTRRRASRDVGASGPAARRVYSSSNASESDLAAHLIAISHLQQQL